MFAKPAEDKKEGASLNLTSSISAPSAGLSFASALKPEAKEPSAPKGNGLGLFSQPLATASEKKDEAKPPGGLFGLTTGAPSTSLFVSKPEDKKEEAKPTTTMF